MAHTQPMTHAILTDLDGVIRIWPPETDRKAERAAGLPEGAIRRTAGLLSHDFPEANVEDAVELWSVSPGEVDSEVLGIFQACRKRAQLILVTNATSRLLSDLRRLGITEDFDYMINSSEVGAAKPDPGIYSAALDTAGVAPGEALFVDDNAEHVAAANRLGIAGHIYVGATALRHELDHLGLLQ